MVNATKQVYKGTLIIRVKDEEVNKIPIQNKVSKSKVIAEKAENVKIDTDRLVLNVNNFLVRKNGSNNIYARIPDQYGYKNMDVKNVRSHRDLRVHPGWILNFKENRVVSGVKSINTLVSTWDTYITYENKITELENIKNKLGMLVQRCFGYVPDILVLRTDKHYYFKSDIFKEEDDNYTIEEIEVQSIKYVIIHCEGIAKYREAIRDVPNSKKKEVIGHC